MAFSWFFSPKIARNTGTYNASYKANKKLVIERRWKILIQYKSKISD